MIELRVRHGHDHAVGDETDCHQREQIVETVAHPGSQEYRHQRGSYHSGHAEIGEHMRRGSQSEQIVGSHAEKQVGELAIIGA